MYQRHTRILRIPNALTNERDDTTMSARRHPAAPRTSCPVLTSPVIGTLVHARDRMDQRTRLGAIRFFEKHGLPPAIIEALLRALVPSLLAYVNDPERIVDILQRCASERVTLFHPNHDGQGTFRAVGHGAPPGQTCAFLLPHPKLPVVFSCSEIAQVTVLKRGTPGTQAESRVLQPFINIQHFYDALATDPQDALQLTSENRLYTDLQTTATPHHFFLFKLTNFWWRTDDPPRLMYTTQDLVDDQETPSLPPDPEPYDAREPGMRQRWSDLPHWQGTEVDHFYRPQTPPTTLTINGTTYKFPPALMQIMTKRVPLLASAEQVAQDNFYILPVDNANLPQLVIPALTDDTEKQLVPSNQLPRTSADPHRREYERTLDIALEPLRYAEDRD